MRDPEEYLWQPGERDAVEREQAARRAQIQRDEVLAWAKQRVAAHDPKLDSRLPVVTKSTPPAAGPTDELGRPLNDPAYKLDAVVKSYGAPAAAAPSTMSNDWAAWVRRAIKKEALRGDKAMAEAIAKTVVKDIVAVERRCEELQKDVSRLTAELVELRAAAAAQRSQPTTSVADDRRRAGALTRARQEIERLRAQAVKCDGTPQGFDLDRLRPIDEWRH